VDAQKKLAAASNDVKLQTTPAFNYNAKGDLPGIGSSKPLMEKVFDLTTATPALTEPLLVGNRWIAARLKQRQAAPQSDFVARKDDLKKRMLPAKQEENLRAWLIELRSKAKIVINPAFTAGNE